MKVSTVGSGRPSSAHVERTASMSAGGPQTKVGRAAVVGHRPSRGGHGEATLERAAGGLGEATCHRQPGTVGHQVLELSVVQGELWRAGVVQEADLPGEVLVAERAQHRHDGRDAAAPADQQHMRGARLGQHELTGGLVQVHDLPGSA